MAISLQKSNQLKSIAILMMLGLHLFNQNYDGLFEPILFVGQFPLSYYISIFCDACVPIFAFVSGYGLYFKYNKNRATFNLGNRNRLWKLYVNFWVILILFGCVLGMILNSETHPGNINKFLLNFFAIDTTYNSTWWFLTIYILFVLSSSFWFYLLNKLNSYIFIIFLLIIYIIAFYFKVYSSFTFDSEFLELIKKQATLFFFTLFQFMLGAFALKYNWNDKISIVFNKIPFRNAVVLLMIVMLVVIHGFFPNLIIAPFTALVFVFLFLQLDFNMFLNKILDFFAPHSTNIWLIHAFVYSIYFKDFIYSFKFVPLIFLALLVICIISSYFVNTINQYVFPKINVMIDDVLKVYYNPISNLFKKS